MEQNSTRSSHSLPAEGVEARKMVIFKKDLLMFMGRK